MITVKDPLRREALGANASVFEWPFLVQCEQSIIAQEVESVEGDW
jgi:hypothetical protein